jgi:hypothetical protein
LDVAKPISIVLTIGELSYAGIWVTAV